jgi:hypothetical protein
MGNGDDPKGASNNPEMSWALSIIQSTPLQKGIKEV